RFNGHDRGTFKNPAVSSSRQEKGFRASRERASVAGHAAAAVVLLNVRRAVARVTMAAHARGDRMTTGLRRDAARVTMGITAAALAAVVVIASGQLPPPVALTHEQERQRMLDLLGIATLPPGAQGSSP